MKTNELNLGLQAWADGQLDQVDLSPDQRAEIARLAGSDPAARDLIAGLRSVSSLLKANPPPHSVPASREFYWSQIQRRMDAADRADERAAAPASTPSPGWGWRRWVLPVFGLATVAIALTVARSGKPGGSADALTAAAGEDSGGMVFRSESDGVTICWLD